MTTPTRRASDTKATNPKEMFGAKKLPLEVVPDSAVVALALAFTEGALKYGRYNWRVAGVRASTYRSALSRHVASWWNGEDADPDTGVPHLANAMACIAILFDAGLCGKLNDDRPPFAPVAEQIRGFAATVERLKTMFADYAPPQYTEREHGASRTLPAFVGTGIRPDINAVITAMVGGGKAAIVPAGTKKKRKARR